MNLNSTYPNIIQNAVKINDEGKIVYLISLSTHDYRDYEFKNGESVAVDGGPSYIRRTYTTRHKNWEDWSLDDKTDFKTVCERLLWGHRGKKGDQPLTYVPLSTLTKVHLKAIVKTQNISPLYTKVIQQLLKVKVKVDKTSL